VLSKKPRAVSPDLDVVIVSYNSAHVLGDLLDSLPSALDGLVADVVVVDNGSIDGTVNLVAARADCRLVPSANIGYAAAINRGAREASGAGAILIMNPDVRLYPDSVRPMLRALGRPHTGMVVPQLRSASGQLEPSLRRRPTLLRALGLERTGIAAFAERIKHGAAYSRPHPVDWAQGAVVLMSRACFEALGGWDESYFLYSEEVDVSLRAYDAGLLTFYEPASVAIHIGGQSGQTSATHAMQAVNRVRLYRRRSGLLASWCYFWLQVATEASWAMRGHQPAGFAVRALLWPSVRPSELGCSDRRLPR
jgi:N-acetylglucosaminyl-diphospho-decaprenol L-rhamnosyltransferase